MKQPFLSIRISNFFISFAHFRIILSYKPDTRGIIMNNLKVRPINKVFQSKPTIEGAGVHLRRAFGFTEVPNLDPFLLLDDFRSNDAKKYLPGFPWHPHRGIETITYMLDGAVEHGDSMGNAGSISAGDIQWMTAGSGIIHQEMPKPDADGLMGGFQLWANLPRSHKMMDPRYQEIKSSQIPEISPEDGVKIRVIAGKVNAITGPVTDIIIDPLYLDIQIDKNTTYSHPIPIDHAVFAYCFDGCATFDNVQNSTCQNHHLITFGDGEQVVITTTDQSVRFLLIAGKPIKEPVAWYGPIVMNSQEELRIAFEEYENGTFVKTKK